MVCVVHETANTHLWSGSQTDLKPNFWNDFKYAENVHTIQG